MARNLGGISSLRRLGRRLAADRRGVTAVITALGLVVLMGFGGLAIDVAKWLSATRSIQSAADQGAYSAAGAAGTGTCPNDAAAKQATAIVAARGYINGQDDTTVSITCPSSTSFKVTVAQGQPMWFTRLFLATAPTATRSASAQIAGKETDLCILALDGYNPSEDYVRSDANAFYVAGAATVNVGCGVAVDSKSVNSLGTNSNAASLKATNIYLAGDLQPQSNGFTPNIEATGCPTCDPVIPPGQILKNQRPIPDPYANRTIPAHSCPANAPVLTIGAGPTNLSPSMGTPGSSPAATSSMGVFCGGLTLSPGANVTVSCGTYILAGGGSSALTMASNAKLTQASSCSGGATGVTFILTNSKPGASDYASINYNGNGELVLTAPNTGPYGGLVFFQDRNAPAPTETEVSNSTSCGGGSKQNKFAGQARIALTGALYFPSQTLCYAGGSETDSANKCTQLIAYNLVFTGNPFIKSQCAGVGISAMSVTTPQLIQ